MHIQRNYLKLLNKYRLLLEDVLSLDIINNTIKERNMAKIAPLSIPKHFSQITDPRRDNKRHKLVDIITIAICGVICNRISKAEKCCKVDKFPENSKLDIASSDTK